MIFNIFKIIRKYVKDGSIVTIVCSITIYVISQFSDLHDNVSSNNDALIEIASLIKSSNEKLTYISHEQQKLVTKTEFLAYIKMKDEEYHDQQDINMKLYGMIKELQGEVKINK